MRSFLRDAVNAVAMAWFIPKRFRGVLLRSWGVDVLESSISPHCFFGGTNIRIGGSFLNRGVFIDNTARVEIGTGCHIGMDALILTSEHEPGPANSRAGPVTGRPVTIGDGCWIGARVTVLPGVAIARGCVVAAGAVVTADCAADGLYAGIPARRLRDV